MLTVSGSHARSSIRPPNSASTAVKPLLAQHGDKRGEVNIAYTRQVMVVISLDGLPEQVGWRGCGMVRS